MLVGELITEHQFITFQHKFKFLVYLRNRRAPLISTDVGIRGHMRLSLLVQEEVLFFLATRIISISCYFKSFS